MGGSAIALILSLALGAFILWTRGMLGDYRAGGVAPTLAAFAFGGAITGWILVQLFRRHVDAARLARLRSTILPGETVVQLKSKPAKRRACWRFCGTWKRRRAVTFAFLSAAAVLGRTDRTTARS